MVGDLHHRARRQILAQRSGGIGQDQRIDAERLQRLDRRAHGVGVALLVVMDAARQHDDRHAAERAGHELAGMAGDGADREARHVGDRRMRTASSNASTREPRPEPSTMP